MKSRERVADNNHRLVWWEIMFIVGENGEIAGEQLAIGCVPSNDVHLMRFEGAIEQAEVHNARGSGEFKAIGLHEPVIAIRTLHEFVSEAGPPGGRVWSSLRNRAQLMAARIRAANHDGETVVEPERRLD